MAFAKVDLLIFLCVVLLFGPQLSLAQCIEPSIRREWRQFSTEEKTAWISAVKVCIEGSVVFSTDFSALSVLRLSLILTCLLHPSIRPFRLCHL